MNSPCFPPRSRRRFARLIPLVLFAAFGLLQADDRAYQEITAEGGTFELGKSVPGVLDLPGEQSFALLRDASHRVVAAAGASKNNRVVAFSHGGFLKSEALPSQPAVASLVKNAVCWAGQSRQPKIAVEPGLKWLSSLLTESGLEVEMIPPGEVSRARADVYCLLAQTNLADPAVDSLLAFAAEGGGLVTAATPWAFADRYPDFAHFPANRLTSAAGIRFRPDGYASGGAPLKIGSPSLADIQGDDRPGAVIAVERLGASAGKQEDPKTRALLIEVMNTGLNLRGESLDAFLTGLLQLNQALGPIVPTRENPIVPGANSLIDSVLSLEDELNQQLPPGRMYAIPAAEDYPGATPEDATRISRDLTIDGNWKGWLSGRNAGGWAAKEMRPTGLYAAPAEVITITAPPEIVGRGYEVVVGAYGGSLRNRDKWFRYPRLQTRVRIDQEQTDISNALGGLITLRVPRDARDGDLSFQIKGAIQAPLYVHGKTDLEEWKKTIRDYPAPWAELASDRMIIALPASYIRELDNPDAVMTIWNDIIDTSAILVQVDRDKFRAERIVFDRQTSAGSMHSGYPVAAHTGRAAEKAVDAQLLKSEGDWGFFHEYGHNHQHDLWSLPGTGETTCNLWSVYLFEEYIGKHRDQTHRAIRPLDRKQRMNGYFRGGREFSQWAMWVALEPYLQVQEAFGWEPYQKVFAEYNNLPREDWPRSQQEKNDQWVLRLSRACGKNLAPFWSSWNLPLSESVSAQLQDLPAWEDHPVKGMTESPGD